MDLVAYDKARFDEIATAFHAMAAAFQPPDQVVHVIPVSSLHGENVTRRSARLPWYTGKTLLDILESADTHRRSILPGRLQVQRVLRPRDAASLDVRTYAGRIASGMFHVGDAVSVLPGARQTHITGITHLSRAVDVAEAGQSINIDLADDVDVGRGSLVVPFFTGGGRAGSAHGRRHRCRRRASRSRRRSAGWTNSRCARDACTCCSTASSACARKSRPSPA